MAVLYLVASPKPVIEGTDALWNEIKQVASATGNILSIYPSTKPNSRLSRHMYGIRNLKQIISAAKDCDVVHIYSAGLFPYPILDLINKPIIYSVTSSLKDYPKPWRTKALRKLSKIVVNNERDVSVINDWGLSKNVELIPTGYDARNIETSRRSYDNEFNLLMASAPWVEEQFASKGVDMLLKLSDARPELQPTFLWRGLLSDSIKARHSNLKNKEKVTVVDKFVEVNDYMKQTHATVLMSNHPSIVKSYPHSLIESLKAGKPVVISNTIPMADLIKTKGLGVVVDEFNYEALDKAIEKLKNNYSQYQQNVLSFKTDNFSEENMRNSYYRIYDQLNHRRA